MCSLEKAIEKIIEMAIEIGYEEKNAEGYIDKDTLVAMAMAAVRQNISLGD